MSEQSGPQKPAPKKSNFDTVVQRMTGKDEARYIYLTRKCTHWDCRQTGQYSFRKRNPDGSTELLHAYCDRMQCRYCCAKRVEKLRYKIFNAVRKHELFYCYTLTLKHFRDVDEGFEQLMDAFKQFKKDFNEEFGKPMRYFWVKGLGANKRPHLHLVCDTKIKYKWLKATWFKYTYAYEVRRNINRWNELGRLTAYMINNWLECYVNGFRGRKIQPSHGIDIAIKPRNNKEGASEWKRVYGSTHSVATAHFGDLGHAMNPPHIVIPPKNCERSEQIPPQDAEKGRRVEANAEGGGWSTSGKSAPSGEQLGDADNDNSGLEAAS